MRRSAAFALSASLLFALPAGAEPFRATYSVVAAGMTVMEVDALIDLARPEGYRIETSLRLTGMARVFVSGEQVTAGQGSWDGPRARPARFASDGTWRGEARRTVLEYPNGEPTVRTLVPPNEQEREPVPPEMQRGTLDAFSALAFLSRTAAATQACDGGAAIFDGRRRSDFTVATGGWERLAGRGGVWGGEALRCTFEGRVVAGFRLDDDQAEQWRRPQQGTAWLASVRPGTPPIPVRLEVPSRFFGRITIYLMRVAPAAASTRASSGTSSPGLRAIGASPAMAAVP